MAKVQAAIEYIFPLVYEFRKERTPEDLLALQMKKRGLAANNKRGSGNGRGELLRDADPVLDEDAVASEDEAEASDASWN